MKNLYISRFYLLFLFTLPCSAVWSANHSLNKLKTFFVKDISSGRVAAGSFVLGMMGYYTGQNLIKDCQSFFPPSDYWGGRMRQENRPLYTIGLSFVTALILGSYKSQQPAEDAKKTTVFVPSSTFYILGSCTSFGCDLARTWIKAYYGPHLRY